MAKTVQVGAFVEIIPDESDIPVAAEQSAYWRKEEQIAKIRFENAPYGTHQYRVFKDEMLSARQLAEKYEALIPSGGSND
jgi:hypothetical protein